MTKQKSADRQSGRIISQNKKAFHDYEILETFEAGIVLMGSEVKSLRDGRANLKDSHAKIRSGEIFLLALHISVYSNASYNNHEPERVRKLLLHKREIKRLVGKTVERGLTLVPLKLYFKDGKVKVELALARGKKHYDKRESLKRKEGAREMDRLRKRHELA